MSKARQGTTASVPARRQIAGEIRLLRQPVAWIEVALLAAFWDTRLVIGIVIDVALLAVAVAHPAWAGKLAG